MDREHICSLTWNRQYFLEDLIFIRYQQRTKPVTCNSYDIKQMHS